jgi:hypothetical protein
VEQGYKTIPVRVIFNRRYLCGDTIFITLKIDNTVDFPRTAASKSSGNDTMMISAAVLFNPPAKRLLGLICRQLGIIIH